MTEDADDSDLVLDDLARRTIVSLPLPSKPLCPFTITISTVGKRPCIVRARFPPVPAFAGLARGRQPSLECAALLRNVGRVSYQPVSRATSTASTTRTASPQRTVLRPCSSFARTLIYTQHHCISPALRPSAHDGPCDTVFPSGRRALAHNAPRPGVVPPVGIAFGMPDDHATRSQLQPGPNSTSLITRRARSTGMTFRYFLVFISPDSTFIISISLNHMPPSYASFLALLCSLHVPTLLSVRVERARPSFHPRHPHIICHSHTHH